MSILSMLMGQKATNSHPGGDGDDGSDRQIAQLESEKQEITKLDSTSVKPGEAWYIIDSAWLSHWRQYALSRSRSDPPGPISNWRLLENERPKPNLVKVKDYRGVNSQVWHAYHRRYGGGPAICRGKINLYDPPVPVAAGGAAGSSSAVAPAAAREESVEVVGERSRAEIDAELRAAAVDVDDEDGSGVKAECASSSGGAAASSSSTRAPELMDLLRNAGLGDKVTAAETWCEEQGLDSLAEIKEVKEEEALVAALQLKPGKAKLLLGRIAQWKPARKRKAAGQDSSRSRKKS